MSIARHHNEWLSLIEVSGPFLSLPVLMRIFPQGLDALDRERLPELRLAYEEWLDDQNSLRPSPAIHSVWVRYVLEHVLGIEKTNLLEGPAIPATLRAFIAEQAETLHSDLVIASSNPSEPKPRMLIQIHAISQGLEKTMHDRHWKASPAMRMLELLRATGVQLGLVTNGEQWMLVNAPKGETSAFVSWYAALWLEEPLTLRAFTSLLGAPRFFSVANEDTLESMLKDSVNEQQEVTDQLGYQVRRAVEVLIRAVDKADQDHGRSVLKDIHVSDLYEAALTVMMRLVFLFSAEERGLLLLGDPLYDQNYAVSTLRAQLRETADQQGEEVLERRFDAWCRLLATFRAVHDGIHHDRLNLPAYGGDLFNPERYKFLEGRTSSDLNASEGGVLPISNRTVLHLLEALQILRVKVPGGGPTEARRLSFRSLDVEQIGHVYEGLLDHIALRASEPVLGLSGTRDKEPEIAFPILLAEEAKGEKSFLAYLKEQTGRSDNALKNALKEMPDVFTSQHLQIACNNDPKMYERVAKFAGLIREDDFGYPVVFLPGSVYVTAGATRRATGTHYTPRSLTEPIVQHTLEPLVYTGPAEGSPKEQWKLKPPAELLNLKICDMAMGSAGFLVQVVRYLSERLVEAWQEILDQQATGTSGKVIQITPEGRLTKGNIGETVIPIDDEEQLILARRLVADRCVYGVDKNPLAVEIAKLSIWLTTMDKGRPFTFLDHALKCGDSLVGASAEDYLCWAHGWREPSATLFDAQLETDLETALHKRRELEIQQVADVRDVEHKAELLLEADTAMEHIKRGCDLLTGARLLGLSDRETEELQLRLLFPYMAGELGYRFEEKKHPEAVKALYAAQKEHAFHWEFEFPEVFEKDGFSAFVGNPPFLGTKYFRTNLGNHYFAYISQHIAEGSPGRADLCAFFVKRIDNLMSQNGFSGLITTNTLTQGDTQVLALKNLTHPRSRIYRADETQWPGSAAVRINIIHWSAKMLTDISKYLNDRKVGLISEYLTETKLTKPLTLAANLEICFQGSIPNAEGLLMTQEEAKNIIVSSPHEAQVLKPFFGEELNSQADPTAQSWCIFFADMTEDEASKFPQSFKRCIELVKPVKLSKGGSSAKYWWRFYRYSPELYKRAWHIDYVFTCTFVTKYLCFTRVSSAQVFTNRLAVIADSSWSTYSALQSTIHEVWARQFSTTLETRLAYTPTDCFETFPFPEKHNGLSSIGDTYHETRRKIMLAKQEGLTATYNRFHNPKVRNEDIVRLRELHVEMDNAVASAYGWNDLDLGHGFHETAQGVRYTISESARREVLARLLKLNHERYEEEVKAGLHEKKAGKGKDAGKKKSRKIGEESGQYGLF